MLEESQVRKNGEACLLAVERTGKRAGEEGEKRMRSPK